MATPLSPDYAIDAAACGMVGDGTTDNAPALQAAVTAAIAAKVPLYIPPGNYVVNLPNNDYIEIVSSLTITGAGASQTRLKITPDRPPIGYNAYMFRIDPNAGHVVIQDLELAGAESIDPATNPNQGTNGGFIVTMQGAIHVPDVTAEGSLTLERVRFTGNWISNVSIDQGAGTPYYLLNVRDCEFRAYGGNIGLFSAEGADRRFHATNCRFSQSGIPPQDNNSISHHHALYLAPHVSTRIIGCDIENAQNNAIQMHSGHGTSCQPLYCEMIDCYVASSVKGLMILSESGPALIRGGTYSLQGGIVCPQPTTIAGARVDCPVNNGFQGGAPIHIAGCQLGNMFWINCVGGYAHLQGCSAVRGYGPNVQNPMNSPVAISDGFVLVEGCSFFGGDSRYTGNDRRPATEAISPTGGTVHVKNCLFAGDYGYLGSGRGAISLYNHGNPNTAQIDVENCVFNLPQIAGLADPQVALYCDGTIPAGAITGRGNRFLDAIPFSVSAPQAIGGRQATCPTPIASASTINLDVWNYDTFHITGTTPVTTITIGEYTYNQRCFEGRIRLIADSAPTLNSGGNIKAPNAIPLSAGSYVDLLYDPADSCWYQKP